VTGNSNIVIAEACERIVPEGIPGSWRSSRIKLSEHNLEAGSWELLQCLAQPWRQQGHYYVPVTIEASDVAAHCQSGQRDIAAVL
jgi:hypothetical protein